MAPLTWRNVDSPNFSGANDMWKVAASLMNSGFDRARQGLNDFRTITTDEQSSALMQQIIGAGDDPAAIAAATSGANAAYLSPEALMFANNQPGVLLDREGKALANTGEGLNNTIRGQTIRGNDFDFGRKQIEAQRADADYALLPEALSTMQTIRTNLASTDPATVAQAQAQQGEFLGKYGRALGITNAQQVGSFLTGNLDFSNATMDNNVQRLKYAAGLDETIRTQDAKGIAANVLGMVGNDPDRAITAIQNFNNIDPETKVATLAQIETLRKAMPAKSAADTALTNSTLFPGVETNRPALPDSYQPVIMQNTGKRNLPLNSNLNTALQSVLPNLGLTAVVTSGGQVTAEEAAQGKGQRTGSIRHDHGGAADVKFRTADGRTLSWERPADVPLLQQAVSGLKAQGLTGFGAAGDYMGAETTHIGYGTPAVWGAKGGKPYQALLDAYNNTQTVASSGSGPTVERAAAANNAPAYQAAMDAITQNQTYQAPINPNTPVENILTTQIEGAWFNIPTVVNGQEMPEEQAIAEFRRGMNPAVGVFQSKRDAEAAAEERTNTLDEMLQEQTAGVVNETAAATQQQSDAITAAATPTVDQTVAANDQTKEIKVSDRWTIPAVDPTASQARQDFQTSQRSSAVNGVLESIKTNLATSEGGGPLANWAGNTWDYFMADPATAEANAASREGAKEALSWYNSEVAKKYFQDNPGELVVANADPIAFAQNFGNRAAPAQTSQTAQAPSQESQQEFVRRQLTGAETIDQMFSAVKNTGAINQANAQYQSITDAVQNREQANESAAETASRLTAKDTGTLAAYTHQNVVQAIQQIKKELGVNSAVAGALLEEAGNFSDGYLGGWAFGLGRGYEQDMSTIRDLWASYQQGNNANRGISSMNAADLTKYQQTQIDAIEKQVTEAQAALRAAIADPNTPPDKVALYEQQLAQLPERTRQLLTQIMSSGAVDSNIRNRVSE